jgi:surface antigen
MQLSVWGGYRVDWVAFRLATRNGYKIPLQSGKGPGDASNWATYFTALNLNYSPNTTPAIGAIAWKSSHVAYVEDVSADRTSVQVSDYNNGQYPLDKSFGSGRYDIRWVPVGTFQYIHVKDIASTPPPAPNSPVSGFAGQIVQYYNGPDKPHTSWFVSPDLKRYWIKDGSTFSCIKNNGATDAGTQSKETLEKLQDQTGQWAVCGGNVLSANRFMFRGSHLKTPDGRYHLDFQRPDGNIVLYGPNGYLWATFVASDRFVMQGDGNLVAYAWNGTAWRVTWQSGTNLGNPNIGWRPPTDLVLQDDANGNNGKLVLYAPNLNAIWDSSRTPNRIK